MAENAPGLHVVGTDEPRRRSRPPGPAVLWILIYAGIFGAGLLYLRVHAPWKKSDALPGDAPARAPAKLDRDALLSADGVPRAAKARYFERLATERCDCGCQRTLADCLVSEKSCSRSPELASKLIPDSKLKTQN
jgi:hypothetical protein